MCATFIHGQYCVGTIWVNVAMHIVLECSALLYCNTAMCDWILVKRHFIWIMGMQVLVVKKRTHNYINCKKLCVNHFTRGPVISVVYIYNVKATSIAIYCNAS